jgi:hypothetical protein
VKRILSIDWDYFFPNGTNYDWGHKESYLFYEALWEIRVASIDIVTHEPMLENFIPSVPNNFWNQILASIPETLYVADSHLQLYALVIEQLYETVEIDNLDAHHDCGYYENQWDNGKGYIECGNWCEALLKLHLCRKSRTFYPKWRKNEPENNIKTKNTEVHYGLPNLNNYDIIFMCRSSCWTPPWYDNQFKELIDMCPVTNHIDLDGGMGTKIRKPNLENALILRDQHKSMIKGIKT